MLKPGVILVIATALITTTHFGAELALVKTRQPSLSDLPFGLLNEGELAIIVNKSNPVDNLSFAELRKIFLGERTHWPNGRRITIVMREPAQAEREVALKVIYRMSESQFNRHFLRATFTGELHAAPKQLATAEGVRKFVFNVPGAIGYVRPDELDDTVKLVRVDGHSPGEQQYKIKP